MSAQDLLEDYPRFTRMIWTYFADPNAAAIADGFDTHFLNLKECNEFWSETRLVVNFDILIRCRFLQDPFNPSDWQVNIWNTVMSDHLLALAHRALPGPSQPALPSNSRDTHHGRTDSFPRF